MRSLAQVMMLGKGLLLPVVAIGVALNPGAIAATTTGTQTLSVNVGAIGKLAVMQSTVNLTHAGSIFASFTGTVTVQYEVRTTASTGNAVVTVNAASEFSPANGPRVAGGDLTYTCAGATVGNACTGSQIVSTSSQASVVTVGSGVCTGSGCAGATPNSVTVNMNLVDSPVFKTGNYSTSLTFSISSI
jgi:hypothetical protein